MSLKQHCKLSIYIPFTRWTKALWIELRRPNCFFGWRLSKFVNRTSNNSSFFFKNKNFCSELLIFAFIVFSHLVLVPYISSQCFAQDSWREERMLVRSIHLKTFLNILKILLKIYKWQLFAVLQRLKIIQSSFKIVCQFKSTELWFQYQGDSGGPLVRVTSTGLVEVVGIVSWGIDCAQPDYLGIYTRVHTYLDWIKEQIQVIKKS